MNSRERILETIEHQEPDQIPFDLGSTKVTGITQVAYKNLTKFLGKEVGKVRLYDTLQQLAEVKKEVLEELEVDTRGLMPNVVRKKPDIQEHDQNLTFTDEWGMSWKMPKRKGLYFDLYDSPLSGEITEVQIMDYRWPDPMGETLLNGLREKAKQAYEAGYAVILESFGAGIFEMACRVRGYEEFYGDLVRAPKVACSLLDKLLELKIRFYQVASKTVGKYIQFVREGDDIAGQEKLIISPDMYRKYIKPRHEKLFKAQKELFPDPFYTFFHSDGAIYDLIPDFLEAGIDILNPVQVSAKGMDLAKLKKVFGGEITFWGGAVNTQQTLPKGKPQEVREEVRRRIECLAPGGGFIFNPVHNIQDDVPPENIMEMWDIFQKLRKY